MDGVERFVEVSSEIMRLSHELREQGQVEKADRMVEAAANVELSSDDLQDCWGGPLNGQSGRQDIIRELIERMAFDVIVETGTYRGITTEWFCRNFKGPVLSCEIERLYHLQAVKRLERYPDARLSLQDSRSFLQRTVDELPENSRVLFYLDAHWKDDLPVAGEIRIILASKLHSVIMIDDFKDPEDDGYRYDDYGPGKALTLELLSFLRDSGCRFCFPVLRASEETGAARGVCVITETLREELDACSLLRMGTWKSFRVKELENTRLRRLESSELPRQAAEEGTASTEVVVSQPAGRMPHGSDRMDDELRCLRQEAESGPRDGNGSVAAAPMAPAVRAGKFRDEAQVLSADVAELRQTLQSLGQSRVMALFAPFAPKARSAVTRAQHLCDRIASNLRS